MKVLNGNLDQALKFMQRKMQSSGIERLIKREQIHHIKNSEKRVLARKNLEHKIRSQDLARKLKAILIKKVRYLYIFSFNNKLLGDDAIVRMDDHTVLLALLISCLPIF